METGKLKAGRVEKADALRGASVFPSEWGPPVGRPYSEERTRWVLARVREHQVHKRIERRAAVEAVRAENFKRQRYLLLTRER